MTTRMHTLVVVKGKQLVGPLSLWGQVVVAEGLAVELVLVLVIGMEMATALGLVQEGGMRLALVWDWVGARAHPELDASLLVALVRVGARLVHLKSLMAYVLLRRQGSRLQQHKHHPVGRPSRTDALSSSRSATSPQNVHGHPHWSAQHPRLGSTYTLHT